MGFPYNTHTFLLWMSLLFLFELLVILYITLLRPQEYLSVTVILRALCFLDYVDDKLIGANDSVENCICIILPFRFPPNCRNQSK